MKKPLADKITTALLKNTSINPLDGDGINVKHDSETQELHVSRVLGWSSVALRSLLKVTDKFFLGFYVKDKHTIIIFR